MGTEGELKLTPSDRRGLRFWWALTELAGYAGLILITVGSVLLAFGTQYGPVFWVGR